MNTLRYLSFEINRACPFAMAHSEACPIAHPERYMFSRSAEAISDETVLAFWRWCRTKGFRGLVMWHQYNEPALSLPRVLGLMRQMKAEGSSGITGLFDDMGALATEVSRLSSARGQVDMSRFPVDFPALYKFHRMSWGEMVATRIVDPKLKAIVSGQWGYYGLPPSKLSCFYYALPFMGYLTYGGFYPKGPSQDMSNAFAQFIKERGGTILLNTKVVRILLDNGAATGVSTADGHTFTSRAVVSNADPFST